MQILCKLQVEGDDVIELDEVETDNSNEENDIDEETMYADNDVEVKKCVKITNVNLQF